MTSHQPHTQVVPQHRQVLTFAEHVRYAKSVSHGPEAATQLMTSGKHPRRKQAYQKANPMVPENMSLVFDKSLRNGRAPQHPHDVHPTRTLKEMVDAGPAGMLLWSGLDQLLSEHGGALLRTICTAFFAPYFSGR